MTNMQRENALASLKAALENLGNLPTGYDPEPDEDDQSPPDMVYFGAGLAAKNIRDAIRELDYR